MSPELISAKEIVDKYDVTYQTVNHYTNFGLLDVIVKRRNIRFYRKSEVKQRIGKIKEYANQGYPLNLIRKMIAGV
ncbi:MAG: MerR family transcriptional regulator [Candidatus Omnitrophica bacterium]|nr:MerR family transcriptional regulator [Candidatus Omnitrophota bacterium]